MTRSKKPVTNGFGAPKKKPVVYHGSKAVLTITDPKTGEKQIIHTFHSPVMVVDYEDRMPVLCLGALVPAEGYAKSKVFDKRKKKA